MKRILLVSHGQFAQGLKNAVQMFSGTELPFEAIGLHEDEDIKMFSQKVQSYFNTIPKEDPLIVFCDIPSGSPSTCVQQILLNTPRSGETFMFSGMNLAMVLTAVISDETDPTFCEEVLSEASLSLIKQYPASTAPLIEDEEI